MSVISKALPAAVVGFLIAAQAARADDIKIGMAGPTLPSRRSTMVAALAAAKSLSCAKTIKATRSKAPWWLSAFVTIPVFLP
jgi:hypothetical protein